jgi:hypothetical protein
MAKISAQLMCDTRTMDGELVFAVCNTARMLTALNADYQARWHGEKRGHHEVPAPIGLRPTSYLQDRLASCRAARFVSGSPE